MENLCKKTCMMSKSIRLMFLFFTLFFYSQYAKCQYICNEEKIRTASHGPYVMILHIGKQYKPVKSSFIGTQEDRLLVEKCTMRTCFLSIDKMKRFIEIIDSLSINIDEKPFKGGYGSFCIRAHSDKLDHDIFLSTKDDSVIYFYKINTFFTDNKLKEYDEIVKLFTEIIKEIQ